jgi:uncharacterized membrane protein YgdD (TMEM256/DUF423 family)
LREDPIAVETRFATGDNQRDQLPFSSSENAMHGRLWILCGGLLAALGVATGAIGAHLLKERWNWDAARLEVFETAVRYQMYHAIGLILAGILLAQGAGTPARLAAFAFLLGIVLFSGGIYAYQATGLKPFVMVVPVGGTVWILGWIALALSYAFGRGT